MGKKKTKTEIEKLLKKKKQENVRRSFLRSMGLEGGLVTKEEEKDGAGLDILSSQKLCFLSYCVALHAKSK